MQKTDEQHEVVVHQKDAQLEQLQVSLNAQQWILYNNIFKLAIQPWCLFFLPLPQIAINCMVPHLSNLSQIILKQGGERWALMLNY